MIIGLERFWYLSWYLFFEFCILLILIFLFGLILKAHEIMCLFSLIWEETAFQGKKKKILLDAEKQFGTGSVVLCVIMIKVYQNFCLLNKKNFKCIIIFVYNIEYKYLMRYFNI